MKLYKLYIRVRRQTVILFDFRNKKKRIRRFVSFRNFSIKFSFNDQANTLTKCCALVMVNMVQCQNCSTTYNVASFCRHTLLSTGSSRERQLIGHHKKRLRHGVTPSYIVVLKKITIQNYVNQYKQGSKGTTGTPYQKKKKI